MQICTYSEFHFTGFSDAFEALKNMGLGGKIFGNHPGLIWVKPMGTGSGNGFSIIPNLKRYAFIALWDSESSAISFYKESHPTLEWYKNSSENYLHAMLVATKAHGQWGGVQPFELQPNLAGKGPLAVLTRATIKKRFLPEFWMHVPEVSAFMHGAEGVVHQVGVGEYPLFMQATFSMWESRDALMNAAYRGTAHSDIVRKTRERGWYAEELFAQFKVLDVKSKGKFAHIAGSFG